MFQNVVHYKKVTATGTDITERATTDNIQCTANIKCQFIREGTIPPDPGQTFDDCFSLGMTFVILPDSNFFTF